MKRAGISHSLLQPPGHKPGVFVRYLRQYSTSLNELQSKNKSAVACGVCPTMMTKVSDSDEQSDIPRKW
jgi:hypothetical protein